MNDSSTSGQTKDGTPSEEFTPRTMEQQYWAEKDIRVKEFTQNKDELVITTQGSWWHFKSTGFAKLETTLYATAEDKTT